MALRCLLFTSDQGTAEPICQVLAGLGVEGDYCSEAAAAVEKVTSQPFQIVIIDWDAQPEAATLLTAARERKASERPLTLAIVSDDASVPQALQAGANSILRKPIMVNQVKDTLTTARDLLRAKQESAATAALAAAAGASSGTSSSTTAAGSVAALPASMDQGNEKTLRRGEFLQPSRTTPGAQFETESEAHKALDHTPEPVDPLEDLAPVAASVAEARPASVAPAPAPLPPPAPGETRGLQWYLNARAATLPPIPTPATPEPPPAAPAKPELLGFDQTPSSYSEEPAEAGSDDTAWAPTPAAVSVLPKPRHDEEHEQKAEAKLFAYISGEEDKAEEEPRQRFRLGKGPIVAALMLAGCAVAAAPQAPWHPQMRGLWAHGQQIVHGWLNPQPVTTAPAPESHESFGRAGDEYKMPVTENIPDATTDPAQIHVIPVVDPTAKKPTTAGANADQTAGQDAAGTNPTDAAQPGGAQVQGTPAQGNPAQPNQVQQNPVQQNPVPQDGAQAGQPALQTAQPTGQPSAGATVPSSGAVAPPPAVAQPGSGATTVASPPPVTAQPAPANNSQPQHPSASAASTPANVPSSLKSQMASMTPDASGNKPPEAAMQSIEPVNVPEAAERALLTDQPAIAYPDSAKGQQGTVTLQILVGRDGTVQDAKFLQGSLAFARTAIDGVKLWKFKPYSMNGRAVSVQTTMTMSFKPGS
jgi:periplasmic protein TonB